MTQKGWWVTVAMQTPAVGAMVGDSDGIVGVGSMEVKVLVQPEMSVWGSQWGPAGGHGLMEWCSEIWYWWGQ